MRYVVQLSGWGGRISGEAKPWRSQHAVIVEADSPRAAVEQLIGKTSPYPLLGSSWEVFELGDLCEEWRTHADHAFGPVTAYRMENPHE